MILKGSRTQHLRFTICLTGPNPVSQSLKKKAKLFVLPRIYGDFPVKQTLYHMQTRLKEISASVKKYTFHASNTVVDDENQYCY